MCQHWLGPFDKYWRLLSLLFLLKSLASRSNSFKILFVQDFVGHVNDVWVSEHATSFCSQLGNVYNIPNMLLTKVFIPFWQIVFFQSSFKSSHTHVYAMLMFKYASYKMVIITTMKIVFYDFLFCVYKIIGKKKVIGLNGYEWISCHDKSKLSSPRINYSRSKLMKIFLFCNTYTDMRYWGMIFRF